VFGSFFFEGRGEEGSKISHKLTFKPNISIIKISPLLSFESNIPRHEAFTSAFVIIQAQI
jgi:hypothetical protein